MSDKDVVQHRATKETTLPELFWTFAKVGVMTFGGGYAMLPILQREVVENKGWVTDELLANYFAIGQCTPGIISVNTATFIGYDTRGILGGFAATFGVSFPSIVIISLIAGAITAFSDNVYVTKAFMGIRACVCVLILSAVLKLWKSAVMSAGTLTVCLIVFLLAAFVHVSPVPIVLGDVVLGLLLEFVMGRRQVANSEAK